MQFTVTTCSWYELHIVKISFISFVSHIPCHYHVDIQDTFVCLEEMSYVSPPSPDQKKNYFLSVTTYGSIISCVYANNLKETKDSI